MNKALTFNDVLIVPKWSDIKSRADVDPSVTLLGEKFKIGIISSNMDTVTGSDMCRAMIESGGIGCLHRFMTIQENVAEYLKASQSGSVIVSIGVTGAEFERGLALYNAGARLFCIDVAHAASNHTLEQYIRCKKEFKDSAFIVGNFATGQTIKQFVNKCEEFDVSRPDAFKIFIGSGSACTTRVVTGCGLPTFYSAWDCVKTGFPVIADGGLKTSGDIAKALGLGCKAVMLGSMLAATKESPGTVFTDESGTLMKKYRGSASEESYGVQGKLASHRTAEGVSKTLQYKGSVIEIMRQIEAGVRSAMTYVGAKTMEEFVQNCEFVEISDNGLKESHPH